MKKLVSIMLAGVMALSMVACGGANTSGNTTGVNSTQASNVELNVVIAHNQTSAENPYSQAALKFKEALEEVSGGRATATVHNGDLGENESELVEKLEMGAVDVTVASPGFMTAIGVKEIDIFSLLYLFDSFEHWEACMDGEFGDAMKEVISEKTDNRFKVVGYWTSSVRDYYGKKEITTPADLKGMTIRTQSTAVVQDFWTQCGAIPTTVAWGELYQALSQGVVDSAENDYTSLRLKEHHKTENSKYICETHHDYTTRLFLTTGSYYEKLTDEQKGWFDEACRIATEANREITINMFEESKQICIDDGAIVTNYEDIDIDAFKAIAVPIQDEFAEENNMQEYLEMIRNAAY